ncbi:L-glutamate gamma-semialdehyde dehydrogenase [Candidatus Thorarchaeota archaeon]|nr:MAG: L-glutamate gamma-semialdehyde dehydrogenase [Candidatus Thorarchaeota archaeon]
MATGTKFHIPKPDNEPLLKYMPNSPERKELKQKLHEMKQSKLDIPLIIGGNEVRTENTRKSVIPHNHEVVLADYHNAGTEEAINAIQAALEARKSWSSMPWYDRAPIFLKAAELIAGPYRQTLNAAAMLDMSKNTYQAEIDAAAELVDFLRFNSYYMQEIYRMQVNSAKGEWDRIEYRPLEGFVFAVTPFNFVSIMGNLPSAPAMMGNVVIWKPASSAVYAAYHVMQVFVKAGIPPGVINFLPGPGARVGDPVIDHPKLAGIHFTGSTETFRAMWKQVASNIEKYRNYPRIVGETGGKDFIFAHESANIDELVTALVRGSFEFQGQKCSASSRAYIPSSIWAQTREQLLADVQRVKMGDVEDFTNLMNAVIDKASFNRITNYIDFAKRSKTAEIIAGGKSDAAKGYFIEPTIVVTSDPKLKLMEEEIFGPVLTIYVYDENDYEAALHLCDETSPYGLTGSVFASDRDAIVKASKILRYSAGNFYINDKPTGAVVGRQPFGGARASGTNDKAGSRLNLMRWVSPRTIKENFVPPRDFMYDYMSES